MTDAPVIGFTVIVVCCLESQAPLLHISGQVSNHFIGASLNTTCGMEICQSSVRLKEEEEGGGFLQLQKWNQI